MFKKRFLRDEVISDEGFRVRLLGRMNIRYTEGDRSINVGAERLRGDGIILSANRMFGWDPPNEHLPVTDADWQRVLDNVVRACEFLRLRIEWDGPNVIASKFNVGREC